MLTSHSASSSIITRGGVMVHITNRTDVGTLTLLLVMLSVYALSSALTVLYCMVSVGYIEGSYVEGTWCL